MSFEVRQGPKARRSRDTGGRRELATYKMMDSLLAQLLADPPPEERA